MPRLLALPLLLLSLAVAGCKDDGDGGPVAPDDTSHVGTYGLVTINGDTVPVLVLTVGIESWTIVSGSIALNADGTYTDVTTVRHTVGDSVAELSPDTIRGTYVRRDGNITLRFGGSSTSVNYEGDTLTASGRDDSGQEIVLVFMR